MTKSNPAPKCRMCEQPKPPGCGRSYCDPCSAIARKESRDRYRSTDKGSRNMRNQYLVRNYNMTIDEFEDRVNAQGGKCAACKIVSPRTLHVDHDHLCCPELKSCGKCVRGIICSSCNQTLGFMKDSRRSIERLSEYLRSWDEFKTYEEFGEEMWGNGGP